MILWEGKSRIDGAPIVAIATLGSRNRKTGPMIQIWIIRSDIDPVAAIREGLDRSICGDCPLRAPSGRGAKGRTCYINAGQAPLSTYRAFKRGAYARARNLPPGSIIRLGAYGDPGALPLAVVRRILAGAKAWTGYTHLWKSRPGLREFCQASVESISAARKAQARGWKTFRLTRNGPAPGEIACPSDRIKCIDCRLCSARASVTSSPHGAGTNLIDCGDLVHFDQKIREIIKPEEGRADRMR